MIFSCRHLLFTTVIATTIVTPLVMSLPAWAAPTGEIVAIQGSGEYRESATAAWALAKVKQSLVGGSFVRTANASTVSLLLSDLTQIKLGQNSMFQVKAVATPPGQTTTTVNLQQGKAWTQAKGTGPLAGKGTAGLTVQTPSAAAAIRGTDWVIEVDDAGRTTLTVLSGEILLSNAQGSVMVQRQEQAVAEMGRAPEKRLFVDAENRVQWLTTYRPDWSRYAELSEYPPLLAALDQQDFTRTHNAVTLLPAPLATMVGAELALVAGDAQAAAALLDENSASDPRQPVLRARIELYRGHFAAARKTLTEHLAQQPQDREAWLALGETERIDGQAMPAHTAYARALALAGKDGLAELGLGKVAAEREDIPPARHWLRRANENGVAALGELGQLESLADNLTLAREHLTARLTAVPDDVVALTGLGLLEIKAGQIDAALQALARAQAIEPRYARAAMLAGVAYYQQGHIDAATSTLRRAADLDPKDPLPHLFLAQIARDHFEVGAALESARTAARLMPNLKSLNQLANDQKGSANLGSALAFFGLEAWALSLAQQAYYPYWAGSHLFLADRYHGNFTRGSELMLGFLTDPTVFGANPKVASLIAQPGHYQSLGLRLARNGDSSAVEPSFTLNGLTMAGRPFAYFLEGIRTELKPRDYPYDASADTFTFGLGHRPTSELSLFAYGSSFRSTGTNLPLPFDVLARQIDGTDKRLDLGAGYRLAPESQLLFKVGGSHGETQQREQSSFTTLDRIHVQHQQDTQIAYRERLSPTLEISAGLEAYRNKHNETTRYVRSAKTEPAVEAGEQAYLTARWGRGGTIQIDGGLFFQRHRQDREDLTAFEHYRFTDRQLYPRLGIMLPLASDLLLRGAYQAWRRPVAFNTLSPVATAGIALADQFVLPGGEQQHLRLQTEWEVSPRQFLVGFAEAMRIENIAFNAFDGAENQRQDLARLDRLRQTERQLNMSGLEALEDRPVFVKGEITQIGLTGNALLRHNLAAQAGVILAQTKNTDMSFHGFDLPYLPRQRVSVGFTWSTAPAWRVQAQAVWRGERFADAANTQVLPAGWDGSLKAIWLSPGRHFHAEAFAANLGRKDINPFIGLALVWRL